MFVKINFGGNEQNWTKSFITACKYTFFILNHFQWCCAPKIEDSVRQSNNFEDPGLMGPIGTFCFKATPGARSIIERSHNCGRRTDCRILSLDSSTNPRLRPSILIAKFE